MHSFCIFDNLNEYEINQFNDFIKLSNFNSNDIFIDENYVFYLN